MCFADFVEFCGQQVQGRVACIIDSGSDEWEGDGGVLQAHDKIQKEMAQRAMNQDSNLTEVRGRGEGQGEHEGMERTVKAPHQRLPQQVGGDARSR